MPLTIGSLFSGIGGLELGLERGIGNGCHTIWQVESEPYCRAVLAKHWPNAKRYEDVRDVGREALEAVDIICGGFPCQDISYAGKGGGLGGERSGLWHEYARIVGEMGPQYVVVENVSALLTRGLGDILGTLASLGYDAEWSCVQAIDVGAPHIRDRLFILADTHGRRRGQSNVLGKQPGRTQAIGASEAPANPASDIRRAPRNAGPEAPDGSDSQLAHAPDKRDVRRLRQLRQDARLAGGWADYGHRAQGNDSREWWLVEPNVGRVANGVPSRVDRLRALGNAVVPQVAEVVGRLIAERERELRDVA